MCWGTWSEAGPNNPRKANHQVACRNDPISFLVVVGEWVVPLVNRYSVAEVLTHLNDAGLRDGSGGTEVSLDQITAAARQANSPAGHCGYVPSAIAEKCS